MKVHKSAQKMYESAQKNHTHNDKI